MSVIIYRRQWWRHPDRFEEYEGGVLCLNTFGFGTTEQLYDIGYPIINTRHFRFQIQRRLNLLTNSCRWIEEGKLIEKSSLHSFLLT